MRRTIPVALLLAALAAPACSSSRLRYPTADAALQLDRVVLYRNGVGYFERQGQVEGNVLRLRVRKDQINDLLKSLTVVKRRGGQALSVSMPLDPQTWANAALSTLAPGRGSLAEVLDSLRGTHVTLSTETGSSSGRVLMVEQVEGKVEPPRRGARTQPVTPEHDHRITVLDQDEMRVVMLSKVRNITLRDGDLAMQFHRSLDATAGEGMFQQVEVAIRLSDASSHDLVVSYVAPAPMWKPTYRVVLPEEGKGQALLQGWAVVDNTSGEDWRGVRLALTSGAPIAFRYDLHTPRDVERTDLTERGVRKRARVAVGETTWEEQEEAERPEEPVEEATAYELSDESVADKEMKKDEAGYYGGGKGSGSRAARRPAPKPSTDAPAPPAAPEPAVAFESLKQSTVANARATAVSGLTRFDLSERVTVPEGSSTMVAIINQAVEAEETFLFKPGGAGTGYEANPYRVVRFRNSTPFMLEPGPIAIYSGGSFVGEGLSEAVGTGTSATIPFAVEPGILVTSATERTGDEMRLLRIVRGVLEVESFARTTTTWSIKSQTKDDGFTVLVRHPKAGWNYDLVQRPPGTEELQGAYLIPVSVPKGSREAKQKVVEQTPSRMQLSIWDSRSLELLDTVLVSGQLSPEARAKLEPIVALRQEIGRIDSEIGGLREQRESLDQRASETRRSLQAITKDPAAGALRRKLSQRLEEFTSEADRVGREIVELQSKRLEKKIALEDLLQDLDLRPASAKK
ncbi:MAG: hypothetical protein ACOC1F_02735 [Myxococcota bacterium]